MRQKNQYIALLCVALLFTIDGVAQVGQYDCWNTSTKPETGTSVFQCQTAYDHHIGDRGWECPYNRGKYGSEKKEEWRNLGVKVVNFAGGLSKVSGGGYNGYESRISTLSTTNGGVHVIGNGDAMVFTDDGGIAGKYLEGKNYRFRVKSDGGWPLRVRAFEFAARGGDTLCFYEVNKNGDIDLIKAYGYTNNCPGGRKNVAYRPGPAYCPIGYSRVVKAKCSGYSWSRNFNENPAPTEIVYTDPKTGVKTVEQGDLVFTIPSGEAEIAWGVGYSGGSVVRAGWVFVIDILSAKITKINFHEVDECRPDEMVVDYDLAVGAKTQRAASVKFEITNNVGISVFDTIVTDVPCGSNQVRFSSTKFGSSGEYTVSITEVHDGWSLVKVSTIASGAVNVRVKPKPKVNLAQPETDICDGEFAYINIASVDGVGSNKQDLYFEKKSTNGEWVSLYTDSGTGRFGVGTPRWDSNSSQPFTVHEYRVKVVVIDINNNPLCESNWETYRVNVYKIPETGPQYHVLNGN